MREPSMTRRAIAHRRKRRGQRTSNSNYDYVDGGKAWCYRCEGHHRWEDPCPKADKQDEDKG